MRTVSVNQHSIRHKQRTEEKTSCSVALSSDSLGVGENHANQISLNPNHTSLK